MDLELLEAIERRVTALLESFLEEVNVPGLIQNPGDRAAMLSDLAGIASEAVRNARMVRDPVFKESWLLAQMRVKQIAIKMGIDPDRQQPRRADSSQRYLLMLSEEMRLSAGRT